MATLAQSILATARRSSTQALPQAQAAVPLLARLQDRLTADLQRLSCLHMLGKIQAGAVESGGAFLELIERIALTTERGHPEPARAA